MSGEGVQFPLVDGERSTQRTGRDVAAAAAEPVDPGLAAQIRGEASWRTAYPVHLRQLTEVAATSPHAGVAVASAGLNRVHTTFEYVADRKTTPVPDAIAGPAPHDLDTVTIEGSARDGERSLIVPYRGQRLHGAQLLAAVDSWISRGVAEPALHDVVRTVLDNPDWLDLRDTWFAALGAGAEMAPTEQLLQWGADVAAVDVADAEVWRRLEQTARGGAGRLHAPRAPGGGPPGADLLTDGARIRAWLSRLDQPLVMCNYGYADGAAFTRLSVAADAVFAALLDERPDHGVVCLATPTDVFAVPGAVVADTRARHPGVVTRTLAGLVRVGSGNRLLKPNHPHTVRAASGDEIGIADSLVLQQGPNYALAKRVQRWRALHTAAAGSFGAVHVAPPTNTRSVTKNRVLAAAYAGAHLFGVEIFAPETSRALMAALLVHDLRTHRSHETSTRPRDEHAMTAAAVHGGLWRVAWETRTAFPFAIARGAPALLAER